MSLYHYQQTKRWKCGKHLQWVHPNMFSHEWCSPQQSRSPSVPLLTTSIWQYGKHTRLCVCVYSWCMYVHLCLDVRCMCVCESDLSVDTSSFPITGHSQKGVVEDGYVSVRVGEGPCCGVNKCVLLLNFESTASFTYLSYFFQYLVLQAESLIMKMSRYTSTPFSLLLPPGKV